MSATIGQPDWMTAPATVAVLDALEAEGGPGCARFVGGCVRNTLLGEKVDDIDIATTLTPDVVIRALKAGGLKAVPTGLDHGTVTAVAEGRPFEITTLRRDVETDGRRAVVAFTTDWGEDAARRDFSMNALYADRTGALLDPTGQGIIDAGARRVVFVGDPATRVAEDHLRILRFFRFQAWYGAEPADPIALAACAAARADLASLPAERIWKELRKLLAAANPRAAMSAMRVAGVLEVLLPEARDLQGFERLVEIAPNDPILRLASLLPADPAVGLDVARRLRLSNEDRDRLAAALGPAAEPALDLRGARRVIHATGASTFADRVTLAWARSGGDAAPWRALLAAARAWTSPVLPVTGADAMAAGLPIGPLVGRALKAVEAWWIEADFPDDREAALQRLRAVAAELGA